MSQTSTNRSAFGNCPHCQGLVRVPLEFKPKSQVQCPHCQSDFLLHQLLDLTVPDVTMVTPAPPPSPVPLVDRVLLTTDGEKPRKFVVPPQLAKGAKRSKRSRRSREGDSSQPVFRRAVLSPSQPDPSDPSDPSEWLDSSVSAEEERGSSRLAEGSAEQRSAGRIETANGSAGGNPPAAIHNENQHRPIRRMPAPSGSARRRRNSIVVEEEPHPVLEFIKMVLGGLLALPLAYAILLWVFMLDPLGVAPQVGKTVPLLVPRAYRPKPVPTLSLPERLTEEDDYRLMIPESLIETQGSISESQGAKIETSPSMIETTESMID